MHLEGEGEAYNLTHSIQMKFVQMTDFDWLSWQAKKIQKRVFKCLLQGPSII